MVSLCCRYSSCHCYSSTNYTNNQISLNALNQDYICYTLHKPIMILLTFYSQAKKIPNDCLIVLEGSKKPANDNSTLLLVIIPMVIIRVETVKTEAAACLIQCV